MRIVILGAGKVGYYLAQALMERGHEIHLIEQDKSQCSKIANELDIEVLWGDGTSLKTLAAAYTGKADAFIAVTGSDEDNLIACQLAKLRFGVKKTIARTNNPKNVEVMKRLYVDIPVSSTGIITGLIEQEVDTAGIRLLTHIKGQGVISEISIPKDSSVNNKKVIDLKLPSHCIIVSIMRNGEMIIPKGDTVIYSGDELLAVTKNENRKELLKAFK